MCYVPPKFEGEKAADYSRRRLSEIRAGQRRVLEQVGKLREKSPRLYRQLAPLLDDLNDWMRDVSWHLEDINAAERLKPARTVQQECKG